MPYADYEDVAKLCGGAYGYTQEHIEGLLDSASLILEGEFRYAEKDINLANPDDLRACCAQMVADVLRVGVGSDYSDTVTYDVEGNRAMRPNTMYRRILGIPWRVQRWGSAQL